MGTLPVVTPAGSVSVRVDLSVAEMNGDKVIVRAKDVAGNEWNESVIFLDVPVGDAGDLVLDAMMADHTLPGSLGGEVATKADILSSANTVELPADSGTIVQGLVVSGTFASTAVRDDVYWQIQEDASNGITVEFSFTIPSVDHRAGVFHIFGRYEGSPGSTHYQELWAWNVASSAWEKLVEMFMEGGVTSDLEQAHEYFERHINRVTEEVKIRVVHNVTSYKSSHNIYFDLVHTISDRR